MRTATEKYNAVLEGKFAKAEFVRQMRLEFPQLITQFNGFDDSVTILKNRGMIFEGKKQDKKIKPLEENLPLEAIDRGVDVELTAMGIDPTGVVTKEQYMQAKKRAVSNLQKNQTHYIDLIAKESPSVDKNDKMKETKRGAKDVDSKNQMKNATLKESVNEASQEESVADYIIKHYANPKTGKSLVDDEIVSDFFKTHPEWEQQADGTEEGMKAVLDNFQEYLFVNYDIPSAGDAMEEKVANTVDDVIDPADYGHIGRGYLKGYNRPHSLSDDDLEVLGRKVVDSLYKGDFDAAKAKFVDELAVDRMGRPKIDTEPSRFKGRDKSRLRTQSDKEDDVQETEAEYLAKRDAAIKKAMGKEDEVEEAVNAYTPGDMFSTDFDYEGMLKAGLKIRINTPVDTMQKIYDSFEDVNYHRENAHLYEVIEAIKAGDKSAALDHLKMFRKEIKETLSGLIEGVFPVRERDASYVPKNGVVKERVATLDNFISLIQDKAGDSGFPEEEEAMEVIEAIAEHYGIKIQIGGLVGEEKDEKRIKEDFSPSPNSDIPDANAEEYDVATAFKKAKVDMSKPVTVIHSYGAAYYASENIDEMSAEAAIKKLEAERQDRSKQYTDDGREVPEDHHGYEFENTSVLEEEMPEGHEYKFAYFQTGDASYAITQEKSGVSEKKGKDHDGDGDVDGDDYMAAKDKAIKKAMSKNEEAIREKNITLADALERYSLGELLDTAEEFYRDQEENDSADMSAQFARQFRKSLDDFDGGRDRAPDLAETKKGKNLREAVKAIISKVLEEGTINEAATNELARIADDYAGFEGMKGAILDLQNLVTDIEAYYDKTRDKIQKVYDKLGEIRNEEGLKVGGFLAPAIETAFMKDLRPVTKQGFTKGLDQPKVKVLSQADVDAHNSGERPLGEDEFSPEPKKTVYTPNI